MIDWVGILQETLMITSFVIIMMLLIEFINVLTRGSLEKLLNRNRYLQIIAGALLGLIPGCMGTFAVVSLYSQGVLSFGALVATMIATSGDEAYFMLALIPKQAILLFVILAILAVISGILVDKIFKNKSFISNNANVITDHHDHDCDTGSGKIFSFKNFSFNRYRIYLFAIIIGIITLTSIGWIGHSHSDSLIFSLPGKENAEKVQISDIHSNDHEQHDCDHGHSHDGEHVHNESGHEGCDHDHEHSGEASHDHIHSHGETDIIKIIIISCSILLLFIIAFSSEHFVKEHLWGHIIKKHLLKIFLWIFGTLIVTSLILNIADFGTWIYKNYYIVLLIAVLIGIIPQSGPHLVFLILYIQGTIPFSILLANSIVQDGHGGLPLLAESKKSFIMMKLISVILGLIIGIIGLLTGF